jgi:hypothetical protein
MLRFLISGAAVLLALTGPAKAQPVPIVQCQIGSYAQVMPDFVCDALRDGAREFTPAGTPDQNARCERDVYRHIHFDPRTAGAVIEACEDIRNAVVLDALYGRRR